MINAAITLCIFIVLVSQKILLLNEEFLILLCFITFVLLGLNNLGESIFESFRTQSSFIEKSLKESLNKNLIVLKQLSLFLNLPKTISQKFEILKTYYQTFTQLFSRLLVNYNKSYLILSYQARLNFLSKVENQTVKLLIIILTKKLTKIIKIKQFYISSIRINQFLCLEKVSLRESINLINFKK